MPLDPNYETMMQQSINRSLIILTARDIESNALIGYVFNLVGTHTHYKTTLHACIDMYWLHPAHRRGWTGYNMLKENKELMRKLGVVRHMIGENLSFTKDDRVRRGFRLMLKRLGYKARDIHYGCLLQE